MASGPDGRYRARQPQDAWSDSRRLSPPAMPPQWRQSGFSPSGPQAVPDLDPWPPQPPLSAPPPQQPPFQQTPVQPPPYQPPPSQRPPSQRPPSQRPPRKRLRKRTIVLLALAGLFVIGLISSALAGGDPFATTAADRSALSSSAAAKVVREELACAERSPASGRVYVRTVTPAGAAQARRLSGDWRWDSASSHCLTSLQLALAAAAPGAGYCTQAGYVIDNPGYDVKATPAPPLTHVAAHAGSACPAAKAGKGAKGATQEQVAPVASPRPVPAHTHSAPAHTMPAHTAPAHTAPAYTPPAATAPAAPPSTAAAPAACTPKTNGGNCYEPGEFCRASDHGVSGIAGDGEPITCTDNDGWRWEAA